MPRAPAALGTVGTPQRLPRRYRLPRLRRTALMVERIGKSWWLLQLYHASTLHYFFALF
jgi:hypothetical protein